MSVWWVGGCVIYLKCAFHISSHLADSARSEVICLRSRYRSGVKGQGSRLVIDPDSVYASNAETDKVTLSGVVSIVNGRVGGSPSGS